MYSRNIRYVYLSDAKYTSRTTLITEQGPETRFDMLRSINSETVNVVLLNKCFDVGLKVRSNSWVGGIYVWQREVCVSEPAVTNSEGKAHVSKDVPEHEQVMMLKFHFSSPDRRLTRLVRS